MAEISAVRFKQWLPEWDHFDFDASQNRSRPEPYIYLFSMSAVQLRALSGVYRRRRDQGIAEGLQRLHDPKRSNTIRDFVLYGYPYSSLPEAVRGFETESLKKPGWLPTAIVVNILKSGERRRGNSVHESDLVNVSVTSETTATLTLPYDDSTIAWSPTSLEPFEIVDGQHRLWAFDEAINSGTLPGDFELPVVAYHGLDIGWQAYLFWSINVSPKRINPSHAFDLYPLLRSQDWLETFSDLRIYREARAQELTELLFEHPESPWHRRINMLGESVSTAPSKAGVTQAGWVRALTSSFLGAGGKGRAAKGLFGADVDPDGPLNWTRPQQAAFLIHLWQALRTKVLSETHEWAEGLTHVEIFGIELEADDVDAPFSGPRTMLNQEQGVRGVLSVSNDLLFRFANDNRAAFEWESDLPAGSETSLDDVGAELASVASQHFAPFVEDLAQALSSFDWRSSDAPGLGEHDRLIKRAFRGSGGYVALREQVMKHIADRPGSASAYAAAWLRSQA